MHCLELAQSLLRHKVALVIDNDASDLVGTDLFQDAVDDREFLLRMRVRNIDDLEYQVSIDGLGERRLE